MLLHKTKSFWNPTENLEEAGLSCETLSSLTYEFCRCLQMVLVKKCFVCSLQMGQMTWKVVSVETLVFSMEMKNLMTPTDLRSYKETPLCHPEEISKHWHDRADKSSSSLARGWGQEKAWQDSCTWRVCVRVLAWPRKSRKNVVAPLPLSAESFRFRMDKQNTTERAIPLSRSFTSCLLWGK